MSKFISEDFLLNNNIARELYHDYAASMPIIDYHCHLDPYEIASDRKFDNIAQIWLYGDHYKWRAMRANGINEKYCTGEASDYEKFEKWAETVPYCLRNPLYHWTHMELQNPFGVEKLLNKETSKEIYDHCSNLLSSSEYSVRNLIKRRNVEVICTTDDPTDTLKDHSLIASSEIGFQVFPTFRPDKAMAVENPEVFNQWVSKLELVFGREISRFDIFIEALKSRHDYFHAKGCRLSDHGLETIYAEDYTESEIKLIFQKIRQNKQLLAQEILKFKSTMLYHFALWNAEKGWTQQFHIGALRNNNSRMTKLIGANTGFDSIGDFQIGTPMVKFFDRLDSTDQLSKTILYNLNPRDNELFATMVGNYNDGSVAGKMQYGSAWWFLDHKDGIEKQLNCLSNMGLISRFVGMVTDSRSFLSYSRHDYFRRILCNLLGNDVAQGELPSDTKLLGTLVQDICYNNAKKYFKF
jgi:glucuronate isomerase